MIANHQKEEYSPGMLLRARGREWVVQPRSDQTCLRLRPLGGSEDDVTLLIPELEFSPPEPATFPWPDPSKSGNHDAALMLRDALQLKLRAGRDRSGLSVILPWNPECIKWCR